METWFLILRWTAFLSCLVYLLLGELASMLGMQEESTRATRRAIAFGIFYLVVTQGQF